MNSWFGKGEGAEHERPAGNENGNLPSISEPIARHLALLDRAQQAIARAESVEDVKDMRDKAEAARKYAESANLGLEAQNYAAEVKLRAERKAGSLIAELSLHGGDRRSAARDEQLRLEDLGISKDQSSRWQLIARLPVQAFEHHISGTKQAASELTTSSMVKLAKELVPRRSVRPKANNSGTLITDLAELSRGEERFACVYANPPWTDTEVSQQLQQTLRELPVEELVAERAHLHLWVGNAELFAAPEVMEAWGFRYAGCLIWVKPQMGRGPYWRVSHEFLLLGVRGGAKFRNKTSMSWLRANRTKHGRKPERVRKLIEKVSSGPYLELFASEAAKGWTAFDHDFASRIPEVTQNNSILG